MSQGFIGSINNASLSTDGAFTANSDDLVPSQKATKTYVETYVTTYAVPHAGSTTAAEGKFHWGTTPLGGSTTALCYSGFLYATRVYSAVYNDLAEYFIKDEKTEIIPNRVYVLNKEGKLVLSYRRADENVIGVCSDSAAFIMKAEYEKEGVLIALSGTIKILVDKKVKVGYILVSSKNGLATKANWFEKIFKRDALIGKVLSCTEDNIALIKVY
jgi:hypothetical protein